MLKNEVTNTGLDHTVILHAVVPHAKVPLMSMNLIVKCLLTHLFSPKSMGLLTCISAHVRVAQVGPRSVLLTDDSRLRPMYFGVPHEPRNSGILS